MSTPNTPIATQAAELQEQNQQLQQAIEQQQQQAATSNEPAQLQREYVVELETGQVFRGRTQQELVEQLKHAHEENSKERKRLKDELEAARNPKPALTPEQQAEQDAAKWIADQQARFLGYTDAEEMKRDLAEIRETKEQAKFNQTIAQFHQQNPDFPATEEAADSLMAIMKEAGLPFNPRGLEAAHLLAVKQGKYQPVTQEANSQVNRPPINPLPTVPTQSNPAGTNESEIDRFAKMSAAEQEAYLRQQYDLGRR